jgi:REP element-mobilizing transposase RayT
MSDKYKIFKGEDAYFVTFTIVDWIKVLEDDSYKLLILNAIKFYQKHKGLVVFAYCIMPNHVHMILQATGDNTISEILRDLKKFTSKAISKKVEDEKQVGFGELLNRFRDAGEPLKRIKNYKVWQDGNRAELLFSNKFFMQKLNYIHNNPVKAGLCGVPWDYLFSSATNYADRESLLEVDLLSIS